MADAKVVEDTANQNDTLSASGAQAPDAMDPTSNVQETSPAAAPERAEDVRPLLSRQLSRSEDPTDPIEPADELPTSRSDHDEEIEADASPQTTASKAGTAKRMKNRHGKTPSEAELPVPVVELPPLANKPRSTRRATKVAEASQSAPAESTSDAQTTVVPAPAVTAPKRRGRPPVSAEEKARREAEKQAEKDRKAAERAAAKEAREAAKQASKEKERRTSTGRQPRGRKASAKKVEEPPEPPESEEESHFKGPSPREAPEKADSSAVQPEIPSSQPTQLSVAQWATLPEPTSPGASSENLHADASMVDELRSSSPPQSGVAPSSPTIALSASVRRRRVSNGAADGRKPITTSASLFQTPTQSRVANNSSQKSTASSVDERDPLFLPERARALSVVVRIRLTGRSRSRSSQPSFNGEQDGDTEGSSKIQEVE
ncbi:hypothetical protein K474DRAFT_66422 [Panus rudis PR-1116 ss-1]|nr:hypothetical protein K474DRAFT_66422 [Panus rudis PR-1116 ss-1]